MNSSKTTANKTSKWIWAILVLLGALAAGLGMGVIVTARNLEYERARAVKAEAEKNDLLEQTAGLRERLSTIERAMEELAAGGSDAAEEALRRQRESAKARSRESVSVGQYQTALSEARAHAEELSQRVVSLESDLATVRQEAEQLRKSETNLSNHQESTQRLVAALQEQLRGKERTLASLESAYQRYKDSNQESSRQMEVVGKTIADLEEVNRRRLRILEQASRRVKDLSENLRTMAVRIDNDTRGQSGMGSEITRMQSAALALDDQINQINNLNAQASRLERRLEQARSAN